MLRNDRIFSKLVLQKMRVVQIYFEWLVNRFASLKRRPFTHLYLVGDGAPWVLMEEAREVNRLAGMHGIRSQVVNRIPAGLVRQCLFLQSPYALRDLPPNGPLSNRVAFSYFHGRPSSSENDFSRNFEIIRRRHHEISRVQVSCRSMQELLLTTGIDPDKVRLIPIGINLTMFPQVNKAKRNGARQRLGLRPDDIVVGSFQKDGEGWGGGDQPKLIKGPDVFVKTVERLHQQKPKLHVLLTGPARGYVKNELARRNVPFTHKQIEHYSDMAECYHALDLMLVTSREEGGPKAVLESMACGIPLVSTRVGQAADLIRHGENGWMVDVEDVDGLYSCSMMALDLAMETKTSKLNIARVTAAQHDYDSQLPLWKSFFANFVESGM